VFSSKKFLLTFSSFLCLYSCFLVGMEPAPVIVDDEMISEEKIDLQCEGVFGGTGYVEAPEVIISCKEFDFSGTIDCSKSCIINVEKHFPRSMFERVGKGYFIINRIPEKDFIWGISCQSSTVLYKELYITVDGEPCVQMVSAIHRADFEFAEKILQEVPEIEDNAELLTAFMMIAGICNRLELAELFIDLGADLDREFHSLVSLTPVTPVGLALSAKNMDFLGLLLRKGANPNISIDSLFTPPLLILAAQNNDLELVETLLQAKEIDVNETTILSETALMHAANNGNQEMVKLLLDAGADCLIVSMGGLTALRCAVQNGNWAVQRLIDQSMQK